MKNDKCKVCGEVFGEGRNSQCPSIPDACSYCVAVAVIVIVSRSPVVDGVPKMPADFKGVIIDTLWEVKSVCEEKRNA